MARLTRTKLDICIIVLREQKDSSFVQRRVSSRLFALAALLAVVYSRTFVQRIERRERIRRKPYKEATASVRPLLSRDRRDSRRGGRPDRNFDQLLTMATTLRTSPSDIGTPSRL